MESAASTFSEPSRAGGEIGVVPDRVGQDRLLLVCAVAAAAVIFASPYSPFFFADRLFFHDSLVGSTSLGLFYDRLFSGESWLWSSSLNAGHPLWMDIEIAPILDPVVLVVYGAAAALGTDWQTPYQITAILWVAIFSLGAAACAVRLTGDAWAGLLAFVLISSGPIVTVLPGQSWGFVLPFRYLPWVLYAYLRLRGQASVATTLAFGTALAFSLSGYQSAYLALGLALLVLADLAVHRGEFLRWSGQLLRPRHAAAFGIPVLAALPSVAFLHYTQFLTVMPHSYSPDRSYFFELDVFLKHLFLASRLVQAPETWNLRSLWHDNATFVVIAVPLLVHGARTATASLFGPGRDRRAPEPRWPAVLLAWFLGLSVIVFGGLGLEDWVERHGALLGMRNFGFLSTGQVLILVLVVSFGFERILSGRCGPGALAGNILILAVLVGLAGASLAFEGIGPARIALSIVLFVAISLVLWRLRSRIGARVLATVVVAAAVLESPVLTPWVVLSLADTAGPAERGVSMAQVSDRRPHFRARGEAFVQYRDFERSPNEDWPFSLLAPAVFKAPSAYLPPLYLNSTLIATTTHFFRLQAYEDLVEGETGDQRLRAVLGVTRPILELVPAEAVEDRGGVVSLVLREGGPPAERGPAGDARVLAFGGSRLTARTEAREQTILIYRDNAAPGWSVSVDGREADLLTVDRVNKAVALPAGRHEIEFVYRPWPYLAAFALRLLALAGAVLACGWIAWRARRRHPAAASSP